MPDHPSPPPNETRRLPDSLICLLIFTGAIILFLLFNVDRELIRLESRFDLFIKEALSGIKLSFLPTLYGEPYGDYPATYMHSVVYLAKTFGSLNTFVQVLPTATALALTLVFVYLTGLTVSRKLALTTVAFAALTYGFIAAGREISLDSFSALGSMGAFYCALKSRTAENRIYGGLAFFLGLAFTAFAYLMRGPIGMVVATAAFLGCFLGALDWKRLIAGGILAGGLFAGLTALFFHLIRQEYGAEVYNIFIDSQFTSRLGSTGGKHVLYYFTNPLATYSIVFPLTLLALATGWKTLFSKGRNEPEIQLLRGLFCYAFLIVLGLSLPGTKHSRYILPSIPAMLLISAYFLEKKELFRLPAVLQKVIAYFTLKKLTVCGAVMVAICLFAVEPIEIHGESSKELSAKIDSLNVPPERMIFYQITPDTDELKYLSLTKHPVSKPMFFSTWEELAAKPGRIVIARKKAFKRLPETFRSICEIKFEGELGHRDFVVFSTPYVN